MKRTRKNKIKRKKNQLWSGRLIESIIKNSRIEQVFFTETHLCVLTNKGRIIGHPLEWMQPLLQATPEQRQNFELDEWREAIYWPELDYDIHLDGLFLYEPKELNP